MRFRWYRCVCIYVCIYVCMYVCMYVCVRVCGLCCRCSLGRNGIGGAGAAIIGAGLVHLPKLQALQYAVCRVVSSASWCGFSGERRTHFCTRANVFSCSLYDNVVDDAGAASIGVGLAYLPQLQTLK
jgi:hypothetical protein